MLSQDGKPVESCVRVGCSAADYVQKKLTPQVEEKQKENE